MSGKRQFGTVRKLPSGRWQARYRDGSGQMFSAPSTFPTKTDATRFLAVVEADIARGLYIDPRAGRVTFAEWSDRWLARPGKRDASTARDRQALASFRSQLGSVLLIGLTPGLVQEAVDLRSKVAAPATVARDFSALRAVLNAAVNADLIARSPRSEHRVASSRAPGAIRLIPVGARGARERSARALPGARASWSGTWIALGGGSRTAGSRCRFHAPHRDDRPDR